MAWGVAHLALLSGQECSLVSCTFKHTVQSSLHSAEKCSHFSAYLGGKVYRVVVRSHCEQSYLSSSPMGVVPALRMLTQYPTDLQMGKPMFINITRVIL